MRRKRDHAAQRLLVAMAVALGIHLLVLAPALRWLVLRPLKPGDREAAPLRPEWVEVISPEQARALLGPDPAAVRPPPPEEQEREEPKPPEPERPEGQVVEIPPPAREERPDEARLLSSYDSKVEKEQVSRRKESPSPRVRKSETFVISSGDDEDGTRADPKKQPAAEERAERPRRRPTKDRRPGVRDDPARDIGDPTARDRETPRLAEPDQPALPRGAGEWRPDHPGTQEARRKFGRAGPVGGGPAGPAGVASLLPTLGPEELARRDGSIDHVEDVAEGDQTFLNTREYKYAWFFNRVKDSVQQHWDAADAHRRHDPYGRIYGVRDRVTVLEVTLNADGTLDDVFVSKDSGVAFLDEAALRAFRRAQPFPNPPPGLQDPDGRIRFRFGFYLEINGGGLRLFRY